jgi:hypothetical protein
MMPLAHWRAAREWRLPFALRCHSTGNTANRLSFRQEFAEQHYRPDAVDDAAASTPRAMGRCRTPPPWVCQRVPG